MVSGGYRKPGRPAAVSGPGALSRRTDGGPGQPVRVASGGAYGERKAAEAQQAAAPMAAGGPAVPPAAGGAAPQPGAAVPPDVGVFGPTEQPNVQPARAMNTPRQMAADNPELLLRVLYSQFPTPAIAALLRRTGSNG